MSGRQQPQEASSFLGGGRLGLDEEGPRDQQTQEDRERWGGEDGGVELSRPWVWGLTQASLTHICPAHVFTNEVGFSTKLLEDEDSGETRKGKTGATEKPEAQVPDT